MKRPALFRRLPSLRPPVTSGAVLPPDAAEQYPALAEDLAVLDRVVRPAFVESDAAALVEQNRYRRQQVVLTVGAAILAGLGGLQALVPDQRWPGLILVALGLILTAAGRTAGELGSLERFLGERIRAERLRAMHFRYLARSGRYSTTEREVALERAVLAVKAGEEP